MKVRDIFFRFQPYAWETSTAEIAASLDVEPKSIIRMDTNTSPFIPTHALQALSRKLPAIRVNDYPDTSYIELRKSLATYCKKRIDNFVVTNGADEALDIIAKTLLDPNDEVIIPTPTYSMFRVTSEIAGAKAILVPRTKTFELNISLIKRKISDRTKIIFLCNPNNPTGNPLPKEEVQTLLETKGSHAVVVDEAYFEFSGKTMADLTRKYDNLLIIRTFSKAFSMAGVRVGYLISSPDSTRKLNVVRPPNSLGVISLFIAQRALRYTQEMTSNVATIVKERERMIRRMCEESKIEVFPSEANFVLFKVKGRNSDHLHKHLMRKGFVLRNFSNAVGVEHCLRVTVHTPNVNSRFVNELTHELGSLN